jgi:conjugative transfer signal peptidase TraF
MLPVRASWRPLLLYNRTDSAPRGWYAVVRGRDIHVGDVVVVRLPGNVAQLAASRGYLPQHVPLLKRIAAVAGQSVCSRGGLLAIDGQRVATAREVDFAGRPLHAWSECRALVDDEVLVLSEHPSSFDSRYFGPVRTRQIDGHAIALWVWQ